MKGYKCDCCANYYEPDTSLSVLWEHIRVKHNPVYEEVMSVTKHYDGKDSDEYMLEYCYRQRS